MKCEDCIHEKVCKNAYTLKVTPPNVCGFFKNKSDFAEVKHGKLKHECLECSICGRNISEICDADSYLTYGIEDELEYCPFCGAKMNDKEQGY